MRFKSETVNLHFGLEKPVRILHVTDVHLSLADDVDGDSMKEHARERRREFVKEASYPERDPQGYFEEAMEYSKEFDCTVITGDVIDFISHANCQTAKKILAGKDYMLCALELAKKAAELDLLLVPYENKDGMLPTKKALKKVNNCKSVGILIGPEGGFEEGEIE